LKRREAVYIGGALGIWVALYLLATLGISSVFACYPNIDTFSWICGHQHGVLSLVTAVIPAYFAGRWIGRAGLLHGGLLSFGGWLIVRLAEWSIRPGPFDFDMWDVFVSYIVMGALAGGVGQLHHSSKGAQ
jgi:hypothetical protein